MFRYRTIGRAIYTSANTCLCLYVSATGFWYIAFLYVDVAYVRMYGTVFFWVYVDRVWQWEGELLNTIGNPKGYILECECLTTTTLLSKYKIMCIHFDAHNLKTHSLSGLRSFLCGHQSTLPFQQASVHRGGGRFDFYPHYFVALVKSINTLTTRIEYILKRNFIK